MNRVVNYGAQVFLEEKAIYVQELIFEEVPTEEEVRYASKKDNILSITISGNRVKVLFFT